MARNDPSVRARATSVAPDLVRPMSASDDPAMGRADQPREQIVEDLVQQIVARARPLRVILFGSSASGEARSDSDIDLLIVMPEGTHRRRTAQRLYVELQGCPLPFDLLVATPGDLERHIAAEAATGG